MILWMRAKVLWMMAVAALVPVAAHAAGTTASTTSLENPIGTSSIAVLIGNVIRAGFGLVGSIALLMFIYGGFLWLTSAGSPERVKKGRDVMVWAVLGIAVMFTAYAVTTFIISRLGSAS
ncbi:MAG: hypothetical protein Q7S96_04940 [bacterium]|nr:hypothetical protein [bacterium]